MKKLMKYAAIFVLPLLFAAGYCVPQMAFGAGIEANTVLNFIEYTPTPGPTPGPTPTPTPTPDPGVIGGLTPQTGDFVAIAIGLLGIIAAISLAFVLRRHISYNFKSLFAAFCVSMLPLALAGTCVAGLNNAAARDAGSLVSKQIDVYVNTEGGPVHYGEGEASNVQTFVNTTDNPIYIDEIALEITSNDGSVDIGTWNAKVGGETIFSGVAGDSKKLAESIYLDPDESFEVTWETEASSEDLIGLVGTAPVKISYKTYDSECTVTFETNGGSTIAPAKVTYGDKLTKPADPVKDNNVLKYWATDEALTHEYDFSTVVTSNFTLYAYWNASEEYKEEIEEEMASELEVAKEDIDSVDGLTDAQKEALEDALDSLIDEYNDKIKKAATQDEVDDLKAEFEQKVLEKEKGGLSQAMSNKEKASQDEIDKVEGLTSDDKARYKEELDNKKKDAQDKIDKASDFASAKKSQEKFDGDTNEVLANAKELGAAKIDGKNKSSEETKKSEAEFMAKFEGKLLPETLPIYKQKFADVETNTKKDIDDATTPSEVQEALANEQKDLKDLFDEAQEILDTKGAYLAAAKATTDEDTAKVDALKNVSQTLRDDAKSKINAEYTALQDSIAKTDDLNKLKEIKDAFDANVSKIVEDIEKLNQDIDAAIREIVLKTKQISADIQAKGINQFDTLELDNELKKMSDLIQQSLTNAVSQEDLQKRLKDGEAQLNDYSSSIVVVALKFADGQESMANYVVSSDQGGTPVMNRAGRDGQNANTKINITAGKTRIQSIVDNNTTTYIPTAQNEFQFTFNKSITTITTTLEVIPDEGYAYLIKTTKDNDTLVFTYDSDRSKKPEGTTFDVEETDVVFGPGWDDYMYGSMTSITKVVIEASFHNVKPKSLAKWFMQSSVEYKQILKEIKGLGNIDTSEVTNFNSTFFGNVSIQKFEGLENWDTGKVTSAEAMFMNCKALKDVSNITGWYFASREKFSCPLMFCQCISLENFAGFNKNHTVSVSYAYNMFAGCSMLTSVDILNFNLTSAVSYEMFSGCNNLHNIFYKDDASKSIGQSNDMFKDCIALPHFKDNVVNATYAYPNNGLDGYFTDPHPTITLNSFAGGHYEKVGGGEITEIDGDWNVSNVQVRIVLNDSATEIMSVNDNAGNNYKLVDNCFTVDFSARYSISVTTTYGYTAKAVYTSEDSTLTFYYDNITHTGTPIPVPESTTESRSPFEQAKNVKTVIFNESFSNFKKITNLRNWFYQFSQLEEVVDIKNLYTDNVDNTYRMFAESGIRHVDLSSNRFYNLSLQSSLDAVFDNCHSLESVIFPDEITENATCAWTFNKCENLLYVNCGKLKMNQAGLYPAFTGCVRLNTITVNNSWPRNLSQMLAEISPNFSTWHVASSEQDVLSNTIFGNAYGDTYTKLEGYALLTSNHDSNDTLTFIYDHRRSTYQQDYTFDVENTTESNIPWAEYIGGISGSTGTVTTVDFDRSFANVKPKSCASWFKGAGGGGTSIVTVNNASNLNTSEATDLSWMFSGCKKMVNPPDTSTWNTTKATNIKYIFSSCENMVGTPNMSNWVTSSMTDISGLFENCQKMEEPPNTSNWVTNSVTDMSCMFHHAHSLKTAPNMSSWNTSSVKNMTAMFSRCEIVTEIDIRSFTFTSNTITGDSDGTDFGMFNGCFKIEHIYYDKDISNVLAESKSAYMFSDCTKLPHYSEVTDDTLRNNKYAYPDNGQTGYFTSKTPTIKLQFAQGSHGHFEDPATPGVAITTFKGTYGAQGVKVKPVADSGYTIDTILDNDSTQQYSYIIDPTGCIELRFDAEYTITATTISGMEAYAYLSSANATNDTLIFTYDDLRTSRGVKTFDVLDTGKEDPPWAIYLAGENPTITTIQIEESFKDVQPLSLCYWFRSNLYNPTLTTISGLENIDTSKVTNLNCTFIYSKKLKDISGASNWNVSNVDDLRETFKGCSSIETWPDFTKWVLNPSGVGLHYTFAECSKMQKFDGFSNNQKTNLTKNFDYTFYKCSELTYVDLTGFNIVDSTNSAQCMFYECSNLEHIYYNKRLSPSVSSSLFYRCENLPHYNPSKIDATYAYPNNGQSGYFTSKTPTITLQFAQGSHGYYVDKEGQQITDGKVTLSYDQFDFKVKPVCTDTGMVVKNVVDNNAPTPTDYIIDDDGYITLDPSAEFTLTAITGQGLKPKAVLDERPTYADDWTFTLYYDDIDHSTEEVYQYDVINTSWDIKSKQEGTKATWCQVASDRGVVFPTVSDGIIPGKIIIDESFKNCTKDCNGNDLTSMAFWFAGMNSVTSVEGLENIPSCITDMTGLFSKFIWDEDEGVIEGSTLDLSDLNTDNVTAVQAMLAGNWFDIVTLPNGFLPQIKNAGGYVSTDDPSYIRGLGVFSEMKTFNLNINGKIFAEEGVTNAEFLFYGCQQLKSLSLTPDVVNLSVLENAQLMFYWMRSLEELDLSGHAAMPIIRGMQMFAGCPNLKTIKLEHDLSLTLDKSMYLYMFSDCSSLTSGDGLKCSGAKINDDYKYAKPGKFGTEGYFTYSGNDSSTLRYDLNGQTCDETHNADYFNYSQTVKQGESFTVQGATKLLDPVGTGETVAEFEYWYLSGDPSETKIDAESELDASASELSLVAKWDIHDKTAKAVYTNDGTLTFYYDNIEYTGYKVFDVPDINETTSSPFSEKTNDITKVIFTQDFYNDQAIKNLNYWFTGFANLKSVEGIQYLYTKGVTSCVEAFSNTGLTSIDLSNNDLTGLVTGYGVGMHRMFRGCTSLTSVKFPTTNINANVSTTSLLSGCTSLEEANFGKLKFEYGTSVDGALFNCTKLTKITTNNTWSYNLRILLFEPEHYSQWTIGSTGEIKEADDIQGNASGDTYTKVDPKPNLSDFTLVELYSISDDIAAKGESSEYWTKFKGYLDNAFNVNPSTSTPYDNGNTSGTLEDSTNHTIINGVPCRIIGLNHDPANGESGITMMATAPVTTSTWGSFTEGAEYDYGVSSLSDAANNWTNSIYAYCKTITKKYTKVSGSWYSGFTTSQGSINTKGFVLSFMELTGTGPGSEDPVIEYLEEGSKYADSYKLFAGITTSRIWTRTLDDCAPNNEAVTIDHSGWLALPSRTLAVSCDVVPAFCLGTGSSNGILDIVNLTSAFDELLNLFAVMLHID